METKTQTKDNGALLNTLGTLRSTGTTPAGKELIFDPETGEFVTQKTGENHSPNAVTVGKIAQDGFA